MITKTIAGSLGHRAELINVKMPHLKCRVNGKCKTWKTRPEDFKLPVKHGLYVCFYITPENAADWKVL